jgi:hypothetical protein
VAASAMCLSGAFMGWFLAGSSYPAKAGYPVDAGVRD